MGCGTFVGTGNNRKPWQVLRAQLTRSWPQTRPGEKRQNLGCLASDPVSRTDSFALGDGGEVYFRRRKPWDREIKPNT